VQQRGERGNVYRNLMENLPERDGLEYFNADWRILVKWIIKK
jgi:hypothetical protein